MTTDYKSFNPNTSTYQDLSQIFLPIASGTPSSITTNYKVGALDLNQIFASITSSGGTNIGFDTGYVVDGEGDLRYIFASINSKNVFNTTSQFLTTPNGQNKNSTTLASNFILPTGYNYFNFVLYGGGGSGSQAGSSTYGTGGGGAGSYIKAINIPYDNAGNVISSIVYTISGGQSGGSGFSTSININYTNSEKISLNAGSGQSTNINSGINGAAGGMASYTNNTTYSTNNITTSNRTKGGNQGQNGTSNGYTSSGSGNNGGSSAPVGNPQSASNTYTTPDSNTYIITSHGGGKSQIVSGNGADGAATPANYNKNASAYRYGSSGCILYWLS